MPVETIISSVKAILSLYNQPLSSTTTYDERQAPIGMTNHKGIVKCSDAPDLAHGGQNSTREPRESNVNYQSPVALPSNRMTSQL